MRRTAILRFSDSESLSTIAAHREIIDTSGGDGGKRKRNLQDSTS
jgi:hypothetical protein